MSFNEEAGSVAVALPGSMSWDPGRRGLLDRLALDRAGRPERRRAVRAVPRGHGRAASGPVLLGACCRQAHPAPASSSPSRWTSTAVRAARRAWRPAIRLNGLDDGEAWRDVGLLVGGTAIAAGAPARDLGVSPLPRPGLPERLPGRRLSRKTRSPGSSGTWTTSASAASTARSPARTTSPSFTRARGSSASATCAATGSAAARPRRASRHAHMRRFASRSSIATTSAAAPRRASSCRRRSTRRTPSPTTVYRSLPAGRPSTGRRRPAQARARPLAAGGHAGADAAFGRRLSGRAGRTAGGLGGGRGSLLHLWLCLGLGYAAWRRAFSIWAGRSTRTGRSWDAALVAEPRGAGVRALRQCWRRLFVAAEAFAPGWVASQPRLQVGLLATVVARACAAWAAR